MRSTGKYVSRESFTESRGSTIADMKQRRSSWAPVTCPGCSGSTVGSAQISRGPDGFKEGRAGGGQRAG